MNTDEKRQAVSDKLDAIKAAIKGVFAAQDADRVHPHRHVIDAYLSDIDSLMDGIRADMMGMVASDAVPTQQTAREAQ
ncbi:hypothetical protein [Burkholderia vietnamiensis]|uniref:hypothetical protein n=1 Tax=Burkholderia vietnamiensis TaxID=60552 RepID=UPI001B9C34D5|nr:hypothetical protein [Burkholderia vietnamiensis]MBR8214692.1 hypothetical protein [Burkholderia vietnamiensis]